MWVDSIVRKTRLPEYGLAVHRDRRIFKKVFAGIASSILKNDGVLPGDDLRIEITVMRTIPGKVRKLIRKDMKKRFGYSHPIRQVTMRKNAKVG